MLRFLLHYGIHLIVPLLIGFFFFKKKNRTSVILLLLAGMLIDLDHLLANPIFDANRCSINFHPLHGYWAIGLYFSLLLFKKTRIVAIGLLIHIVADLTDCYLIGF